MKREPFNICDGSYADETRPFSAQDVVNYLYVPAEQGGTRSPAMQIDCPGLREVMVVGDGPHRGEAVVGGNAYVVSGNGLYQLSLTDGPTLLGVVPGTGRVMSTFNQITNGHQILFSTGSAGYVWNDVTATFSQVTDSSFPGALVVDYLNHLGLYVEPLRRYWGNSAIDDLTSYSALETYRGESSPDLIVSLKVSHGEVVLFSEHSTDFFANTGQVNALFQNKKIPMARGCASPFGVIALDNTLFWPGDDGIFYRLDNYSPLRRSTFPIEQDIATCDLSKCFGMAWEDKGHKVAYWTFPDGHTWGYNVATGKWHRRQSYGLNRWRLNTLFQWNGIWYGGDFQSGMLYKLVWGHTLEGADPLVRTVKTGVLHANQNVVSVNSLEVVTDTGGPVSVYEPLPSGTNFDVVVMQGGAGFALVNYVVASNSFSVTGVDSSGYYFQSRPFKMTGGSVVDFTIVNYTWSGANSLAIVAMFPNGSGSMLAAAVITHGARECVSVAKLSETRLVAFFRDSGVTNFTAQLYAFDGDTFTLLDTLGLDESKGRPGYCNACTHNGKAVFVAQTGGNYITITNTADTLSAAYSTATTVLTTDVLSTGTTVVLSNGQAFTTDGTEFTNVQATLDSTNGVAYDGTRVFEVDQSAAVVAKIRLAASPYTRSDAASHYDSYPGAATDYVFIPQDSSGDNTGEVLYWNGSAYIHASGFEFAQWAPLSDINNMVATVVRENE